MKAYPPQAHYRLHPGYVTWILHRLTGLGLAAYLCMHIWVIHNISLGKEAFNEVMAVVQSPLFHFLEVGLLFCVAFHALNGVRIVLIDYGPAAEKDKIKTWAWGTLAAAAVITVVGGVPMILLAFH
ncbi:MAG: succinate dehydrogenase, cytochrome b556 subunit [Deltaproteobacteria bacterium]|nr:succinate dehydrogenase, cytochrome b556 subunit [Deltaproteobacteria bacterium]